MCDATRQIIKVKIVRIGFFVYHATLQFIMTKLFYFFKTEIHRPGVGVKKSPHS